jgi:co-chaperonin GroES (HSP10)
MRVNLREIAQAADPREALFSALGGAENAIEVFHNGVLVATYVAPEKTQGGIIRPDRSLAEDRFQGKCALVIKVGPDAFRDNDAQGVRFHGDMVHPGEWVFVRPSDGTEMFIGRAGAREGVSCRLFRDIHIMGRVPDPSMIY